MNFRKIMNSIGINGEWFSVKGKHVNTRRESGKDFIYVNDERVTEVTGKVIIEWKGDLADLSCADAVIHGNVNGDISAAEVKCGDVGGDVSAADVKCGKVNGDITAASVKIQP